MAEGVESPELGLVLLASGLGTMAQGYAIAKPVPPEEMPNWLVNWKPPSLWTQAGNFPMLDKALPAILPHLRLLADLRVRTPNKNFADAQVASGGRGRTGRHGKLPPVDNSLALEKSLRTLSCPATFVEKALKQNLAWQRAFAKANQILMDTGELSDAMIADVDRKTLNLLQTLCRLQSHRGNTAAPKPELQEDAT